MQCTAERWATFNEALAKELDDSLTTAYIDSDRLSWVQDPESMDTLDRWLEMAEGIRSRLIRERSRRLERESKHQAPIMPMARGLQA